MAYVYRGTNQETPEEPTPIRGQALGVFDPSKCGTYAGYARHLRSDVPPCDACHAAWLEYRREWRSRKKVAA